MPTKVDDQQLAQGAVYARAILEVAEERGLADQILEELEGMGQVLERMPAYAQFLANPLIDDEVKSRLNEKALRGQVSELLADALQVVKRKERLDLVPAIVEAYRREYLKARGVIDVEVRTAVPLSDDLRARLTGAAARYTGKHPNLIERVDPSLLGGLVVLVGDDKIDSSIATSLKNLSATLLRRGSEAIQRGGTYTE